MKLIRARKVALGGWCNLTDLHFFNFFSLDGKLFVTSKFSDKNFLKRNLRLLSSLRMILFFSDRLFLLYKSSFERTLKKRAFAIEGVLIKVKCIFIFLLISNREKGLDHRLKFI